MENREIIYEVFPEKFYKVYDLENSSINYSTPKEEYRICRYCNLTNQTFKSVAHFLPEFMGNKTLFSYNECDKCNSKFGLYETNINAFSGVKNTFIPIKGKKKYPKFKSNDGNFTSQIIDGKKVELRVDGNMDFLKIENGILNIKAQTQTFTPLYVYKGLVKFGLSLLKKEDIYKFEKAIKWLGEPAEKIDDNVIPLLLIYNESRPPLIKPIAILSKRKNNEVNSPEFSLNIAFGFHRIQIFLPFNSDDNHLVNNEKIILPLNFHFLTQKEKNQGKWGFTHFDMNFLNKSRLFDDFKLNFKNSEDKNTPS